MTTFDAETFAFLSSIKEPVLEDGATRTRLLDMMNNLIAPHPCEIVQWLQMAEFRDFASDNLLIFLLLGKFIARMLGWEGFECTVGGTRYQCARPEEVKMELEYRYNEWAYEMEDMAIDMPYAFGYSLI
ncbi:hypothetical protein FVER53590_03681 [Fusarium verticillioides]|nr:hypothetical protein FVER53590_03681 [Fusarium verticillioides]